MAIVVLAQDLTSALGRRSAQGGLGLRRSHTVIENKVSGGRKGNSGDDCYSDDQSPSVCSPSKSRHFGKRPAGMWCIVKKAFDYYDYDKGGDLDHQEFDDLVYDLCHALSTTYCKQKTKEIIRQIDENGDGSIQFNELLNNLDTLWVVLRRKYKISDAETLQLSKRKPKDVKHNKEMFEFFKKIMRDSEEMERDPTPAELLCPTSKLDEEEKSRKVFMQHKRSIEKLQVIKDSIYSPARKDTKSDQSGPMSTSRPSPMRFADKKLEDILEIRSSLRKKTKIKYAKKIMEVIQIIGVDAPDAMPTTTNLGVAIDDTVSINQENLIQKIAEEFQIKSAAKVPANTQNTIKDSGMFYEEDLRNQLTLDLSSNGGFKSRDTKGGVFLTGREHLRKTDNKGFGPKSNRSHGRSMTDKLKFKLDHMVDGSFINKRQKNAAKCSTFKLDTAFLKLIDSFLNTQEKGHFFDKYSIANLKDIIGTGRTEIIKINTLGNSIQNFINFADGHLEKRKALLTT
jgi:hypothetical protein